MFRPSREELDALEALGNKGWNWTSLLEYMKRSESTFPSHLSPSDAEKYAVNPAPEYHGTTRPIKKSFPKTWPGWQGLLFDAAENLNIARNGEMENGSNVGSMSSFTSVDPRTSKRSYAVSEYYKPNANKPNLLVLINSQVSKVIFEVTKSSAQKASGAKVIIGGNKIFIMGVKKDIILSAGTLRNRQF